MGIRSTGHICSLKVNLSTYSGAIIAWEYVDRFTFKEQMWPVLRAVLYLIALNIILYFAMGRLLAWEAHLGGFVAGWVTALLVDPRGRELPPEDE